jgi:diguanylate cyclase (GGDEF)-like protein
VREILELCIELDEHAGRIYADLASASPDERLRTTFLQLQSDEAEHAGWWDGLLEAWDNGLLPDVVNETGSLTARLEAIHRHLSSIDVSRLGDVSASSLLAAAARLEFHMIDPVFNELVDLTEPAQAETRYASCQEHLQRLIGAIEDVGPDDSLWELLSAMLSRTWRDNQRLAIFATHDILTGLYSRRALNSHLPQWAAWSARYGHPLTVMLIDVDNFQVINDELGHDQGDTALRAVAGALLQAIRASDLIVRYGGDEFAVVAPETAEAGYRDLCLRIKKTIGELQVVTPDGTAVPLSVSIGGAVAQDPAGSPARRIEELLASADRSLYMAKTSGRNQAAKPVIV